jgi:hypothetical protein
LLQGSARLTLEFFVDGLPEKKLQLSGISMLLILLSRGGCYSKRPKTAKYFSDDFTVYLVNDTPKIIVEAFASTDADDWKEVVHSEIDSILSHGTWELIDRPYGCKLVGCKWVFKRKLKPDDTIDKYKARLMGKGYTQKEGEDFSDSYSPVARLITICVLFSLAVSHGLLVHQMDVKTTFLNWELEEEIYMTQPDEFIVKVKRTRCVSLCMTWNKHISSAMRNLT